MTDFVFIIVEKNDLCRLGLQCIVRDLFQLSEIIYVNTKIELHRTLLSKQNATVILDFESIDVEFVDELSVLAACFPRSNWLFVNDLADESFLFPLTNHFSKANFVLKTNDFETISSALNSTSAGKKYYCSEALMVILHIHNRKKDNSGKKAVLTTTELELVQLFTQGKTAREIADMRCLSHHTVNTHRKNIFRKLNLNNIQELIKFSLKNGLVDLTEYYI